MYNMFDPSLQSQLKCLNINTSRLHAHCRRSLVSQYISPETFDNAAWMDVKTNLYACVSVCILWLVMVYVFMTWLRSSCLQTWCMCLGPHVRCEECASTPPKKSAFSSVGVCFGFITTSVQTFRESAVHTSCVKYGEILEFLMDNALRDVYNVIVRMEFTAPHEFEIQS